MTKTNDTLSDMLTRIRTALLEKPQTTAIPATIMTLSIGDELVITLKYDEGKNRLSINSSDFLAIKLQSVAAPSKAERQKRTSLDWKTLYFVKELAEVFPEEWNDWQHWISDMMDSRESMQLKGMKDYRVSLITFYRLTLFAFHIGIDKVFILATRRTTR